MLHLESIILGWKITLVTENNVAINNDKNASFQNIISGVPQGSIHGVRYCLLCILMTLKNVSNALSSCYRTVPSAMWEIFSKFLIFCNLFHEPLGEWVK